MEEMVMFDERPPSEEEPPSSVEEPPERMARPRNSEVPDSERSRNADGIVRVPRTWRWIILRGSGARRSVGNLFYTDGTVILH